MEPGPVVPWRTLSGMNAVDFAEVERKYDVDAASVLPSLRDLPGVTWVDAPVEQSLDAVYFDTADLALAAHRIVDAAYRSAAAGGEAITPSPR